jgi:hypothetical protein
MDLRPWRGVNGMESYDAQNQGLDITYEDYEPGWDSATGIARTAELTLWACAATPANETITAMAQANAASPRLMADPAALHEAGSSATGRCPTVRARTARPSRISWPTSSISIAARSIAGRGMVSGTSAM